VGLVGALFGLHAKDIENVAEDSPTESVACDSCYRDRGLFKLSAGDRTRGYSSWFYQRSQ
jgi:hypothetical protein